MYQSIPVLAVVLAVGWAGPAARAQASGPTAARIEVGEPFPDIGFPALADHKFWRMSEFRGEKTILHIFASW